MSPAQTARRTVNVASSPSLGICLRSSRCARHRPIQPAPSTVEAIATVADWRVVAIQCKRNANTIVLRKPATVHSRPARCAPSNDRSAPAYAARMTGRRERIISAYSCSASIAATPASANSHQPRRSPARAAGRRARPPRAKLEVPLPAAEAAPAAGVVVESGAELVLAEIGPERVDEDQLGIGELPQEKVRNPQLAGGTDQEVGVRHLGRIEISRERLLVHLFAARDGAVGRVHDLGPPAVVERDPEIEGSVPLGLAFERSHTLLQRGGRTVAAAHKTRAHSLPHEVGQLALDRLSEDLHQ